MTKLNENTTTNPTRNEQVTAEQSGPREKPVGLTLRSIIIGFIFIVPAVFWGVYADIVSQTDLTSPSLMMPPVIALLVLLIGNSTIGKKFPKLKLTQREMITVYIMLSVSVVLSGMGLIQFLCSTLAALPHFQTAENGWGAYLKYVPSWMIPSPHSAIEGFYKGETAIPWYAWWKPVVIWSGFFFALVFCMLCINVIIRKQWVERERLTFPIVYLPLEMTDEKTKFFKNRLMWAGFALAAGIELMNGLNYLYPSVPHAQIRAFNIAPFFAMNKPWNAIGNFWTTLYPLAIGLGFLLSTDVSFSCWFFFLLTKVQSILTLSFGWTAGAGAASQPPFLAQQGAGAFFGIVIMVIWLARRQLKDVFLKTFTHAPEIDDSGEPLGYRTATIGLLAGFGAMLVFCLLAGLSPFVGGAYILIYLLFSITIARMRAEAGPAWTFGPDWNANQTLVNSIGSKFFAKQNLIMLAYLNWFSMEMRCDPMPGQLEAMKMTDTARAKQRSMLLVMVAAIVVGIAIGFWSCLAIWYKFGAATAKVEPWRTAMGAEPFNRAHGAIINPMVTDWHGIAAMTFGAVFVLFLSVMRTRFIWFPFHPVGYALAGTWTMHWLWMPLLIAWLLKTLIIRYAGIKGYKTALPFFLGLILGDYVMSSFWAVLGWALHMQMYRCFPC